MRQSTCRLVILLAVDAIFAKTVNETKPILRNSEVEDVSSQEITNVLKTKKGYPSTSSSSGDDKDSKSEAESLDLSISTSESKKKMTKRPGYIPKSSEERRGWRKWHRKCKPCPEDMKKKWRDYSIQWICGAYQRARRTFKSKCMMEYRNCQDGTMFVKIHDSRCKNQTGRENYHHGDHFFYEYKVTLSGDSSDSKSSGGTSSALSDTNADTSYR